VALTALIASIFQVAEAQSPLRRAVDPPPSPGSPPYRVFAGPEYAAGGFRRFLMGDGYRALWTAPLTAPVLDLQKHRGGLTPIRVGGGFQTQTIHLRGGDDGYYLFRSVNKAVRQGLEPDLQDTPAGWLVQEQTSGLHPAGAWVIPPLLDAVGVPQSPPELFIMPDDPALGEHRERFAGILGMLVESPDKGESGEKRYMGSDDIAGTEDFVEVLEASPSDRVDTRNLLAARLVDLIVGDPDRNFDNYRWIAFDSAGGRIWRAVPMDRDPAFMRADGLLPWVVRETFIPKFVSYGPEYEDVTGLWASQPEVDRLLLADLDRPTWDSVVAAVQAALTDAVVDAAVRAMPRDYQPLSGNFLARSIRSRRDALPEAAERFYLDLAREVDIHATSAPDVADVAFAGDGSLTVALHSECRMRPLAADNGEPRPIECRRTYYERRFDPEETEEVRIYLRGGDDHAVVRGEGPQRITVRVIGGEGDDTLEDASRPSRGRSRVVFYDHEGDDRFVAGPGTRVERDAFEGRVITDFVFENKRGTFRDYGSGHSWQFLPDYEQNATVILGLRRRSTSYGFRRDPWAQQRDLTGLVSVRGGFGGGAAIRRRLEGSAVVVGGHVEVARDLWSYRFPGYGNDTPMLPSGLTRVPSDEVRLGLDVELPLGEKGGFRIGPAFRYLWPTPHPEGPLALESGPGSEPFGQAGMASRLRLSAVDHESFPRLGVDLRADASAYAPVQGELEPFGGASGEVRGYLPLPLGSAFAARVGGGLAWGSFPAHESVFLGGRRSIRGYRGERFAGDAAVYGSSELRLPIIRLTLLTRGDLGVLGFGDAGRVFMDGDSPGSWHTAWGGGVWYRTMGVTGSLVYALGEQRRLHAFFGLPF
jgi:hypothetical protein